MNLSKNKKILLLRSVSENKAYLISLVIAASLRWIYTFIGWAYNYNEWQNPIVYKAVGSDFSATIPIILIIIGTLNWAGRRKSNSILILSIILLSITGPVLLLLFTNLIRLVMWPELLETLSFDVFQGWFFRNVFFFFVLNVLYLFIRYQKQYNIQREELLNRETMVKDALLRTFWYQVNPKFLFSTLDAINDLIKENKDRAKQLVVNLSEYYRFTLNKNDQHTPAIKEIESVKEYLEIQKIISKDKLNYEINIARDCEDKEIPSFITHFLIENILSFSNNLDYKELNIKLKIFSESNYLVIETTNTAMSGNNPSEDNSGNNFNESINDIISRFQYFYDHKVKSEIIKKENLLTVRIKLPETHIDE